MLFVLMLARMLKCFGFQPRWWGLEVGIIPWRIFIFRAKKSFLRKGPLLERKKFGKRSVPLFLLFKEYILVTSMFIAVLMYDDFFSQRYDALVKGIVASGFPWNPKPPGPKPPIYRQLLATQQL